MKYMIMMFGGLGATLETRTPEWITSMHQFMLKLDGELKEAGEVVASHGLVDPSQAKTVRFQNGVPVPTDGPFAEIKESLAGYWIVEGSQDRAIEIAARVVGYTEFPMEVRQIRDEPPDLSVGHAVQAVVVSELERSQYQNRQKTEQSDQEYFSWTRSLRYCRHGLARWHFFACCRPCS